VSKTFGLLLIATLSTLASGAAAESGFGSLAKARLGDLEATSGRGVTTSAPLSSDPAPSTTLPVGSGAATPSATAPDTSGSATEQPETLAPGGAVTIVGPGGSFRASNRIADGAFQGARGVVTSIQNVGNNVSIQNITSVTINFR